MIPRFFVYKPLLIEQCTYQYRQGNQEKSFTIQRKRTKSDIKRDITPPIEERILRTQQQPKRFRRHQFEKSVNKTIDNSMQDNSYIQFNMSIMRQKVHSFYEPNKVQQLIKDDKKLLKRNKKTTDFEQILKQQQTKASYSRQIKRDVTKLLDNQQENSSKLFRQVESPQQEQNERVEFTRKLSLLNEIKNQEDYRLSNEAILQQKIQQYLKKQSQKLIKVSQHQEKSESQLPSQSSDPDIKVSQNFLMNFVGLEKRIEPKERKDASFDQKKYEYWMDKQPKKKRQVGLVFSSNVRQRFQRMKKLILDCLKKMKLMKLDTSELLSQRVFMRKPYQREGSYMFFKGVQKNDIELVRLMLEKCRYYAFDINENFQTALHICARKGWTEIMKLMFEKGCYPDSKDICDRTPLHYAIINDRKKIVQILLSNHANPWSSKENNYDCGSEQITKLLKVARRLDILLIMSAYKNREKIWKKYNNLFFEI